jgi:hypothetical protein
MRVPPLLPPLARSRPRPLVASIIIIVIIIVIIIIIIIIIFLSSPDSPPPTLTRARRVLCLAPPRPPLLPRLCLSLAQADGINRLFGHGDLDVTAQVGGGGRGGGG